MVSYGEHRSHRSSGGLTPSIRVPGSHRNHGMLMQEFAAGTSPSIEVSDEVGQPLAPIMSTGV